MYRRAGEENAMILLPRAVATCCLAVLLAGNVAAAPMPPPGELGGIMETPAQDVTVVEPHLLGNGADATTRYLAYPALDVLAALFGSGWREGTEAVEFRALDGYVARIGIERFDADTAFLAFARADGAPFTVDNLGQNETGVPLGPYYLIWDNITNPDLVRAGASGWPYQVAEIAPVRRADTLPLPPGLERAAGLTREKCLVCHQLNGIGGTKAEGNLARMVKAWDEEDFLTLVLTPAAQREGSTMPALTETLPEAERRAMARAIFSYLVAVPVTP